MGEKADAFSKDEQEKLEQRFGNVETALETVDEMQVGVEDIIPKAPHVKSALDNVGPSGDEESETENVVDDAEGGEGDEEGVTVESESSESETAADSWDSGSENDESSDDQSSLA